MLQRQSRLGEHGQEIRMSKEMKDWVLLSLVPVARYYEEATSVAAGMLTYNVRSCGNVLSPCVDAQVFRLAIRTVAPSSPLIRLSGALGLSSNNMKVYLEHIYVPWGAPNFGRILKTSGR